MGTILGVPLLERSHALGTLSDGLEAAAGGTGRVVAVQAEAGGGKSALVQHFVERAAPPRVLSGWCTQLSTPLPYGPFLDIAREADPALETALESGNRERASNRLLDLLERRPNPVVMVVEDIHWIDQASADLLTVIAERAEHLPLLLVVTLRPEHVDPDHPARLLMWKLPAGITSRIGLDPLTLEAVQRLVAPGVDAAAIHTASGGNPFFVSELAASDKGLPPTVRDTVLARTASLPEETRDFLGLVAVSPAATETRVLDAVAPGWEAIAESAEAVGLIEVTPARVRFRHELARRAVEEDLLATRRRRHHAAVLSVLGDASPARSMHHALGAGDVETILSVGPIAAAQAQGAGSHREAAAHLRAVLEHADLLDASSRATFEESLAAEAWAIDRPEESEAASRRALAIRRAADDPAAIARNLRRIARVRWFLNAGDEAERLLDEALDHFVSVDAPAEEAYTVAYRALVAAVRCSGADAFPWVERAKSLLSRVDAVDVRCSVMNDIGNVEFLRTGDPRELMAAIDVAEREGLHTEVVKGHVNMAAGAVRVRDYALAAVHVDRAREYTRRHQVAAFDGLLAATAAQMAFETGRWDDAVLLIEDVLEHPSFARLPAQITLARLKVRRGDVDASEAIDEALGLAEATGEIQRLAPAVGAAAEHAWLTGRLDELVPRLAAAHRLAMVTGSARWIGETSIWLHQAGALEFIPDEAEPGAKAMALGRWDEAVAYWDGLGVTFEAAVSLGLSGDVDSMLEGLARLDAMEAVPMAKVVRQRLKELGVKRIPRGPRRATRTNAAGLTARQMDVLHLVVDGMTNPEIAERLYLSNRTVDHHVAAILQKLQVGSRKEVAEAAARAGVLADG